jgi:hypothetical protein
MAHTTTTRTRGIVGAKAERIVQLLMEHPDWNRQAIANEAACSVARVGEVVRYLDEHGWPKGGTTRSTVVVRLPGDGKTPFYFQDHEADRWTYYPDGRLDLFKSSQVPVATYAPHCWIGVSKTEAG